MKTRIRLIENGTYDDYMNMAIDEALAVFAKKTNVPVLRLGYKWKKPGGVSLGINGNTNDIDKEYCIKHGIGIVRRPTGGQGLFHNFNDFTYCIVLSSDGKYGNLFESYKEIAKKIIYSFKILNIKAGFDSKSSIVVNGKKICGNAQTRVFGNLLQHGSIFYDLDINKIANIFKIRENLVRDKTTSILDLKDVSYDEVYSAFKKGFLEKEDFFKDEISNDEMAFAKELLKNKYLTDEWNFNFEKPFKGSCHVQ